MNTHTPLTLKFNGESYHLEKDSMSGSPMNGGFLYQDGGFWSMCVNEVISDVVDGGSPIMNWIPTRGVDFVEDRVGHLSWVGPKGFTGEQTYMEYMASLDPADDCDYGPTQDWNGYEYYHSGYDISVQSPVLKPKEWGQRYCETQPILRVRGPQAGINLENDAMWALGRAGIGLNGHLKWNIWFGDPDAGPFMSHGIDTILQPGWVQSRLVSQGQPVFADPLVEIGIGLSTPAQVLQKIKGMVRKIRARSAFRGYTLTPNDTTIVLSPAMWTYLADSIAHGSLMAAAPQDFVVNITPEGFFRERDRITSGFFGFGFIPVDSQPVPVLVDDNLAANVDLGSGQFGVTGNIYILTRYFAGMTILEQRYQNWNSLQGYPTNMTERIAQNGMVRTGWKIQNNKCFQYYAEISKYRILSKFQPLQGVIRNVTATTILENENEGNTFGSPDWYPFDGQAAGAGYPLIAGRVS